MIFQVDKVIVNMKLNIITVICAGFSRENARILILLKAKCFFFATERCCCTWRHLRFPTPHDPVMIVDSRVTMEQSTYLQSCNHLILMMRLVLISVSK